MFENTHFPKATKYWYMGRFYDWPTPTTHPMSHALHYGTSVFEGIRAYPTDKGPAVFRLTEHIDRFMYSAGVARMKSPYTKEQIIEVVKLTMRENKMQSAYIRPLLFYSYGNLGLVPKFSPVELLVAVWEWGAYLGEKADKGVSVYIVPWRRIHHSQLDMKAKLGGLYILSTISGLMAREKECDEAVFLNLEGHVAEGPGENLFLVKNGVLKTNDRSESILEGITRTSLLEIARDLGIQTAVGPLTRQEFFEADEAFFSGTAVETTPIVQVTDGSDRDQEARTYTLGTGKIGPVTHQLTQAFQDAVRGKVARYEKWLTYVEK
jgi:branched-chain amino acid aminotransferase